MPLIYETHGHHNIYGICSEYILIFVHSSFGELYRLQNEKSFTLKEQKGELCMKEERCNQNDRNSHIWLGLVSSSGTEMCEQRIDKNVCNTHMFYEVD